MGSDKHHKSSWKANSASKTTPWGSEIKWHAIGTISGKCLKISGGCRTSLKYYPLKDEVLFLYRGKILVVHGDEGTLKNALKYPLKSTILHPGELMNIQSGCPYRIEAIEDSEVIEIGSREGHPPIRLADDYGRKVDEEAPELLEIIGENNGSS
jgi:hypothetical protein